MPIDIDTLNGPQREAVVTIDGPLLVLAGAGSGKTRVLTYRIANLDREPRAWRRGRSWPSRSRTRRPPRCASAWQGLVGPRCRGMWVSTFHSMCVRILRADAERLGFTRNFTIYDTDDQKRLYKEIMAELDIDPKRFPVNALMNRISSAKNELVVPGDFEKQASDPVGKVAARVYAQPAGAPQGRERLRLRRPACSTRTCCSRTTRTCCDAYQEPLPLPHGGRVPGHEPRPVRHHGASGRRAPEHHGGGRRRPVHLLAGVAPTCATSWSSSRTTRTPTR